MEATKKAWFSIHLISKMRTVTPLLHFVKTHLPRFQYTMNLFLFWQINVTIEASF